MRIFRQIEQYNHLIAFHLFGKSGENYPINGTLQISPGLGFEHSSSVMKQWFSDKNEKGGIPLQVFFFSKKFPLGRTVPFVVRSEQPVFPCKKKALFLSKFSPRKQHKQSWFYHSMISHNLFLCYI